MNNTKQLLYLRFQHLCACLVACIALAYLARLTDGLASKFNWIVSGIWLLIGALEAYNLSKGIYDSKNEKEQK